MSLLARGLRRRQSWGAIDVADVFATSLYTGNQSTQTITNEIDLAGEGGLVWGKSIGVGSHFLIDTVRGISSRLITNSTNGEQSASDITSFNSDGFALGWVGADINTSGSRVVWTFRRSPRFFDVVTYTGNGTNNRSISHALGAAPGMVVIKALVTATQSDWITVHRSQPNKGWLRLNLDYAVADTGTDVITFDASTFTVAPGSVPVTYYNQNAITYIAYLFAHDPDGVIQCGSYTGNGSTTGPTVTLGWEPQYLLIKNSSATANWVIYDNARDTSNPRTYKLFPNLGNSEDTADEDIDFTSTGFQPKSTDATINTNGNTYVYLAIKKAS